MTDIELLIGDNYFKQYPDHVLGEAIEASGPYGKQIIIKSDANVEDIASAIVGSNYRPLPQPFHLTMIKAQDKIKTLSDKIAEAIAKTKSQAQNPPDTTGHNLILFSEVMERWGGNATEEELQVWTWYNRGRMFSDSAILKPTNGWSRYVVPMAKVQTENLTNWIENGLVCYDGEEYMPAILFYSGNVYERRAKIILYKDRIIEKIGKSRYEAQLERLEREMPEKLKILAPEDERLYISPIDPFIDDIFVDRLADNTVFSEPLSVRNAYVMWLDNMSASDFKNGSNSYEIVNYYLGDARFRKEITPEERIKISRRSQLDGIALFNRFMFEALTREDQQKIQYLWNSEYNNFKEYDFTKIPVGFEINRYFNNALIDPRPALWQGVKFLSANGSGIVAFDVGVGKTMTAILAVANAMYTGQCKRPLIVVPNPTYKKWIKETVGEWNLDGTVKFNGVLPQFKDRINDYYNLGVEYESRLTEQWPKDYTITFITYEGLMRLGFGEGIKNQIKDELFTILNQGNDDRDALKLEEDVDKILGNVTSETIANVDDLGFDYIVVDEAHNFKKIFTRVKGEVDENTKERNASPYQLTSGEPSGRGLKLFCIAHYIMRQNALRNVVLLTATPFTNSPLEIFSMLALVSYKKLGQRGIANIKDFFDKFINEEVEEAITVKGTIEPKAVIKSFNNRQVLQNILFSSIIYKTGEEAGVLRPTKIVYPYIRDHHGIFLPSDKVVETRLQPTHDQEFWLAEISKFANEVKGNGIESYVPKKYYDDKGKLQGRVLMAISLAANCTLSPYLMRIGGEDGVKLYDMPEPDYEEYINSSPKLKYVCECIKTVKEWHESRNEPVSGQVIYMNMATDYFPLIKEYLVKKVGYKAAEIEIIIGGMAQAKKERIKEKFLGGEIKIIIGSATIREGIDLQNRSTVLYNCALDWNPTDIQQLEGRIWRQGNQHSYVRIVTPLIENSLDVFMFQKLEEKTARINNIWYRKGRGNVLKLEEFDPQELKMGLMTDPVERAKTEIRHEAEALEREQKILEDNLSKLNEARKAIKENAAASQQIEQYYAKARPALQRVLNDWNELMATGELNKTEFTSLESKSKTLTELLNQEVTPKVQIQVVKRWANAMLSANTWNWDAQRAVSVCDQMIKSMSLLTSVQKNVLEPKQLTIADDLQPLMDELTGKINEYRDKISLITSDSNVTARMQAIRQEMIEKKALSKPLSERVKEFTRHNYLLSCLKDVHDCTLETTKIVKRQVETIKGTKLPVSQPPAPNIAGNYYVHAVSGEKQAILLGPFKYYDDAEKWVSPVMNVAKDKYNLAGKAHFAQYGVVKMADSYTKPGKMNGEFKEIEKQEIIQKLSDARLKVRNAKNNVVLKIANFDVKELEENLKELNEPAPSSLPGPGADKAAIQARIDALLASYEVLNDENIKQRAEALELTLEIL